MGYRLNIFFCQEVHRIFCCMIPSVIHMKYPASFL
uniref:Uncharacterized protein n=1 Tax=Lepeophtheirus salmonis TaxID=72036 RepID=A0A0K2T474_LEPSM